MIVNRSALVAQPATHLFDLIEAAEHYPRFLPWCAGATIVSRDDSLVSADIRVSWRGMSFEMRTRNPKRRPEYMAIHLERGPFRRFEGEWRLTALAPDACKVAFMLDYEFDSVLMTRMAGPLFNRIADTLVDAFVQHALATPVAAAPVLAAPAVAPPVEGVPVNEARPPAPPALAAATDTAAPAAVGSQANDTALPGPPVADPPAADPPATAPKPPPA